VVVVVVVVVGVGVGVAVGSFAYPRRGAAVSTCGRKVGEGRKENKKKNEIVREGRFFFFSFCLSALVGAVGCPPPLRKPNASIPKQLTCNFAFFLPLPFFAATSRQSRIFFLGAGGDCWLHSPTNHQKKNQQVCERQKRRQEPARMTLQSPTSRYPTATNKNFFEHARQRVRASFVCSHTFANDPQSIGTPTPTAR
jgi:hypothetical protein